MSNESKPSKNEDEYFARRDAELLTTRREQDAAKREEAERVSHLMKCPKCGRNLTTASHLGVEIDVCNHCHGMWLDAGELERLLKHQEPGFLQRVFGDVVAGIRGTKERA